MKRYFPFLFLLIVFMAASAFQPLANQDDIDYASFVKKHASRWGQKGTQCGDYTPDSYTVVLKNTGKETVDIKCAVQEKSKKWRCFNHTNVKPNDTVIAYACAGTGKFLKWAKKTGDKTTVFPTDEEVNQEYKE